MKFTTLIMCLFMLCSPAFGQNLLLNGDFEKGESQGQPVGWHSKITGVITVSEWKDPDNKKGLLGKYFKDGCGHIWGRNRPWPGLFCPECKQMITTEESADWYTTNYKWVKLDAGSKGKGLLTFMDDFVGANQGVRLCSDFIKAEKGAGYKFGVEARIVSGTGMMAQMFVECFEYLKEDETGAAEAKEWVKTLDNEVNPYKHTGKLKRTNRGHIYPKMTTEWTKFESEFVMRQNHQFDRMYMTLYAYGAKGEVAFDNAWIRKMTPAELAAYKKKYPAKEARFKYID